MLKFGAFIFCSVMALHLGYKHRRNYATDDNILKIMIFFHNLHFTHYNKLFVLVEFMCLLKNTCMCTQNKTHAYNNIHYTHNTQHQYTCTHMHIQIHRHMHTHDISTLQLKIICQMSSGPYGPIIIYLLDYISLPGISKCDD